jgi:PAS domain S-box-containing protein
MNGTVRLGLITILFALAGSVLAGCPGRAATALPWIILACGLVLAGLVPALGINAARRARAQNELDRIFNLSLDLIAVANFERHFTRVNPAAEQILGYTQDELLERPYLDFVHPDDRERTAAEAAALGQGNTTLSFENRYVRKDGSYRVLEWTATPVVEESVMYVVARDVTERRRAEIELERLAGEQAALRRVATLVADGVGPEEVFAAVATEVGRLLEVEVAVLNRYDPQDMITVVGMWTSTGATGPTPVGSRLPLGGRNVTTLVCRTGRSARIDHADVSGAIGIATRDWGLCSSVGVPVSVEGRPWGVMIVALTRDELLPADAEARLAGFTELIATAVANAQARVELRSFADEQAALRRVATLVARGTLPEDVFAAVTAEAGRVLGADYTAMGRYDPDGGATSLAQWVRTGAALPDPVGTSLALGGRNVQTLLFQTRRAARIDDYAAGAGVEAVRQFGLRSSLGVPISVAGRLWGVISVASSREEPLPADAEARLAGFTELVATAIANAQARLELRGFAEEQAALRRVATLVARAAPPEEVFAAVTEEAGRLLEVDFTVLSRYDPDDAVTIVGTWTSTGAAATTPIGSRFELGGRDAATLVFETGGPARLDDYVDVSGAIGDVGRGWGFRSAVGVPISVEGRMWGFMVVAYTHEEALPADTEGRLAGFTELVASALANAQARVELRGFAEEQAALRRVATLVARGAPPEEVFAAVTAEAGGVLHVDFTSMSRYDPDGVMTWVGSWSGTGAAFPIPLGTRAELGGRNMPTLMFETGRPKRIDYADASGAVADLAREVGIRSSVGAPISVEGRLWGVLAAVSTHAEPLPADTEGRLAGFTELVATAIANAEAKAALAASRARIVAAGDAARRRMERDLHDGAQQRLVSLALRVRAMQATPPEAGELSMQLDEVVAELRGALDELREIASGLHPAVLAEGGLRPALKTLARRSAVPVSLDVGVDGRLPEPVELAAYYVVAEALTNTAKHADASDVDVTVTAGEGVLRVAVRDDGRGGADLTAGSGLVGLTDRVEALGGRLRVNSPPGAGTTVQVMLPLTASGSPGLRAAGTSPPSGPGPARPAEPNRPDKARES